MIQVAVLHQQLAPDALAGEVRRVLGKPLRRAAAFTQLAACGAASLLDEAQRMQPSALFWQSTSGPRAETLHLLGEMAEGGETMPYDFLATQPAIAAAQLQPLLPGLTMALHCPLDRAGQADWSLLLTLAVDRLQGGKIRHALCAQLDVWPDRLDAGWLLLSSAPLENAAWQLHLTEAAANENASVLPDQPDLPRRLEETSANLCRLAAEHPLRRTVEFVRCQPDGT